MSASTKSPVWFVVLSWAMLVLLAGCESIVSVNQYALPAFWIPRLFITTLGLWALMGLSVTYVWV